VHTDINCFELSWKEYKSLVRKRFDVRCVDPMMGVKDLRQTRTVNEYRAAFDTFVSDCIYNDLNLSESDMVKWFVGGLKKNIQMVVRMFDPPTVEKAFRLARLYERATTGYTGTLTP